MLINRERILTSIFLVGWCAQSAIGELELSLSQGGVSWYYQSASESCGYVQEWNGAKVILQTEVTFPKTGKPGSFPKESWFGLFLQDTAGKHRYCAGFFNPLSDDSPAELRLGLIRYERDGHWAPFDSKAGVGARDGKCQLRLQYLPASGDGSPELLLEYAVEIGKWITAFKHECPKDFRPDQIGFSVDSVHEATFGPVVFDRFTVIGDGPAVEDSFDGTVDPGKTWKLLSDRMESRSPMRYRGKLLVDERQFLFERGAGDPIRIGLLAETTMLVDESVRFDFVIRNAAGGVVYREEKEVRLSEEENRIWFEIPSGKADRNGVYPIDVDAHHNSSRLGSHVGQFAVIPARDQSKTFETKNPYIFSYSTKPDVARRLGFGRFRAEWPPWIWSVEPSGRVSAKGVEKVVEQCEKEGLLAIGPLGPQHIGETATELSEWIRQHSTVIKSLRDRFPQTIKFVESGNEPEIWPIESGANEWLLEGFAWSELARTLNGESSKVQLSTTSTEAVNLAAINQCLRSGGQAQCDWIAVHGYRSPAPPEFGHVEEITAIREMAPNKPVWETANEYPTFKARAGSLPSDASDLWSKGGRDHWQKIAPMTQAAYLARSMLSKLSAGYKGVAVTGGELSAEPTFHQPSIVSVAALTSLLKKPNLGDRLHPRFNQLQAVQFRSRRKPVTAMWSLQTWRRVRFKTLGRIKVHDLFGNEIQVLTEETPEITVGQAPIYLVGPIEKVISDSLWSPEDPPPSVTIEEEIDYTRPSRLRMRIRPAVKSMKESLIAVEVENSSDEFHSGALDLKFTASVPPSWALLPIGSNRVRLAPGESATVLFAVTERGRRINFDPYNPSKKKGYLINRWVEGYFFRATLQSEGVEGNTLAPRFGLSLRGVPKLRSLQIDGVPDEWSRVPEWPTIRGDGRRQSGLAHAWSGPSDFNPSIRVAWTQQGLAFLAEVEDDWHDQPLRDLRIWECDSVQLALNPTPERIDFLNYLVLTMGLTERGVQCILQRNAFGLEAGPAYEVEYAIVRQSSAYGKKNGTTTYEALVPWSLLKGFNPQPGSYLGFSALVSDSDGWRRKGWQGVFLCRGGQIVDPRRFADITLVDEPR